MKTIQTFSLVLILVVVLTVNIRCSQDRSQANHQPAVNQGVQQPVNKKVQVNQGKGEDDAVDGALQSAEGIFKSMGKGLDDSFNNGK